MRPNQEYGRNPGLYAQKQALQDKSTQEHNSLLSQMSPDHVREEPVSEGNPKERGYVYMHN